MECLGSIGSLSFPLGPKRSSSRKPFVFNSACPKNHLNPSGRQERAYADTTRHYSTLFAVFESPGGTCRLRLAYWK